jgi:DinB superfamily
MKQVRMVLTYLLLVSGSSTTLAQTDRPDGPVVVVRTGTAVHQQHADQGATALDAQREKRALQVLFKVAQTKIVSAADAMPADKYGFAPSDGEFKGVRTFGQEVKHLAATNFILSTAALGEDPPTDAGDETGPEMVRTKAEILEYLVESFVHLGKAIDAIGNNNAQVKSSPISPLRSAEATRLSLAVESMIHAFNHYGQMVEYLRMNGIVPPASRP